MKATAATVAALVAIGVSGIEPAQAQQNEIIAIYNSAENDAQFGMFSYRRSLGATLDEGLSLRIDGSRGVFDVTGSEGTIDTLRLLVGYRIVVGSDSNLTFYGGASSRQRDYSVLLPGLTEFDDVGAFGSVEYNADFPDGGEVFGLVEYDTTEDLFYASGFYQADLGSVKIGPTVNYLEEGDYTRRAAGLRVTFPVSDDVDVTATGAWAEGDTGGPGIDSSYIEMQLRTRF
jgi:hypothetical protein